jgi:NADPH:quinone reductase-like Zn-dependent oxidoreductase
VELVRSLGASDVIDYTAEEIFSPDRRYDIIVDTVGSTRFADAKGSLAATGVYIPVVSSPADMFLSMTGRTGKQRIITGTAAETPEAIRLLAEWLARGELRAVIDSRFPLAEVAAAHRRVDSGRKRGSVLLDMTAGAVQHS